MTKLWIKEKDKQVKKLVYLFLHNKKRLNNLNLTITKWWLQRELNQRHEDFQSSALPTELWSQQWRFRRDLNPRSSAWQADVIDRYTTEPKWLREMDLNQRPLGYEPSELPSCSIPRYYKWRRKRDSNPCAALTTSRFSRPVPSTRLGYSSNNGA